MNFAERAFRYLFRKKGKAIILFWVLLITETMILSTVTILRASEVARIELLGKSKAKLLIEREKAEELFTDDEYKKLEKLENVKAVNRVAEVQLYPMDFKIITKSESVDADNQKLRIMAYDSLEDDGPFADGQIHLTKGKYPRKEGEIVVNQFLAEVNQWEIGETVCFKSHSGEQSQASISGIYISGIEEKQGKEPLAVNRIENTIYGKPEFVCHLQETCGYENLIVYVDNPEQLSRTQLGMLLSFAISPIIAETSASYLAKETQTLRLEQQEQENTGTYIDGYIAPDLKIQDVEVHITKEMVLMDIGMISGILIIAVLVAGITIMKKRPKQILSEMS